ncbi:MAG: hypothetical protein ACKO7P_15370 [Bacteroidota bacterium]
MKTFFFLCTSFILFNSSFFAQIKPSTIKGDFDGNKTKDKITIYESKPGTELPAQLGGESPECNVKTTLKNIKNISLLTECGQLINEGDLDGNGSDEFSLVTWSPNGTQVNMNTYKIQKGILVLICSPQFEPGIGTEVTQKMLENRVFKKDGGIYYIDSDAAGILETKQVRK